MPIILNTKLENGIYFVPDEERQRFTETPRTDEYGSRIYITYEI